jgi:bleomycin hydrolase
MKKMYEKDTAPSAEVLRKRKATMMEHIWKILATHLGDPPQKFSYRHRVSREADIDHKIGVSQQEAGVVLDWTPQTFAKKFAGFNANDWITISAYPGLDKNKFYRVRDEEIAKTGPGETRFRRDLINVTPTELEGYVQSSITHQVPLWSAIEVLRDVDHDTGIMHPDLYERSPIYGPNFGRDDDASNKLLSYSGYSQPRHAVLINGMDWPQNAKHAIKYRVENSWGYFNGDGGEYHMYREWLLKYVYEVTVHISLLKPEQGDLLKSNPTSIDPHLVF